MYILKNEHSIIPYNGEVLKRFVGSTLIKTISNPTDEQLREFGYKPLVEDEMPERKQGFGILKKYEEFEDYIKATYVQVEDDSI